MTPGETPDLIPVPGNPHAFFLHFRRHRNHRPRPRSRPHHRTGGRAFRERDSRRDVLGLVVARRPRPLAGRPPDHRHPRRRARGGAAARGNPAGLSGVRRRPAPDRAQRRVRRALRAPRARRRRLARCGRRVDRFIAAVARRLAHMGQSSPRFTRGASGHRPRRGTPRAAGCASRGTGLPRCATPSAHDHVAGGMEPACGPGRRFARLEARVSPRRRAGSEGGDGGDGRRGGHRSRGGGGNDLRVVRGRSAGHGGAREDARSAGRRRTRVPCRRRRLAGSGNAARRRRCRTGGDGRAGPPHPRRIRTTDPAGGARHVCVECRPQTRDDAFGTFGASGIPRDGDGAGGAVRLPLSRPACGPSGRPVAPSPGRARRAAAAGRLGRPPGGRPGRGRSRFFTGARAADVGARPVRHLERRSGRARRARDRRRVRRDPRDPRDPVRPCGARGRAVARL